MQLFLEATAVGMLIAVLGYLFNYLAIHVEFLGFNRWYCKNGFACK